MLLPAGGPRAAPHLRGTWRGGTAPSSCPWLPGGRHRRSWGRRGPAVLPDPQSSISCRSGEGTAGQRPGPRASGHRSPSSPALCDGPVSRHRPRLRVDSGQERPASQGSRTLAVPQTKAVNSVMQTAGKGPGMLWPAPLQLGHGDKRGRAGCWVFSGLQTGQWTQWEQRWLKQLGAQSRSLCLGEKTDKGSDAAREMDTGRSHSCTLATEPGRFEAAASPQEEQCY